MTILVTGASGFIGSEFLNSFSLTKERIITVSKSSSVNRKDHFKIDLTNIEEVKNLIQSFDFKFIYHFAGYVSPDKNEKNKEKSYEINFKSVSNLIENIEQKTNFIFTSTDKVYIDEEQSPHERSKKQPISYYGKMKLLAEDFIKNNTNNYTILRLPIVHSTGSHLSSSYIDKTIIDVKNKINVNVFNDVSRSFLLVSELSKVFERSYKKPFCGTFNVGSNCYSYYNRLKFMSNMLSLDMDLIHPVESKGINPRIQCLSTNKIKQRIGLSFS